MVQHRSCSPAAPKALLRLYVNKQAARTHDSLRLEPEARTQNSMLLSASGRLERDAGPHEHGTTGDLVGRRYHPRLTSRSLWAFAENEPTLTTHSIVATIAAAITSEDMVLPL